MKNFKTVILYIILLFINKIVLADVDGLPPIKPIPPEKVIEITAPHKVNIDLPKKDYGTFRYIGDGKAQLNKQQFNKTSTAGNTATATKTNPVRLTDDYGNTATGKIQTETRVGKTSALAKGMAAIMVADVANNHLKNLRTQKVSEMYAQGFADGDWGKVAEATTKMLDFTGFGGSVADALYNNDDFKQQVQQPIQQQAIATAKQSFDEYQRAKQANSKDYAKYSVLEIFQDHPLNQDRTNRKILVPYIGNGQAGWFSRNGDGSSFTKEIGNDAKYGISYSFPEGNDYVIFNFKAATERDVTALKAQVDIEQFMPNEADLSKLLEKMMNAQNTNTQALTDLTNALWANGGLNLGNTQTQVVGGDGANTFTTTPYTPIGSDVAQQTQFIIHNNGNVTTNIVKRPDLAANTSQAPTRQQVGQDIASTRPQTQAPKESASASAPDMCAMNPNSLMCAQVGNVDYEDLSLPEKKIELKFEPSDIFNSDGTCPAPKVFNVMNKQFSISYEPICDFARGARPMVILLGMVISMGMAYAAVKEI